MTLEEFNDLADIELEIYLIETEVNAQLVWFYQNLLYAFATEGK